MKKYILFICVILSILVFSFQNIFAEEGDTLQVHNPQINTKNIKGIQSKNVNDLFSGAGVYSLPLQFVKGPLEIVPHLSLSYNSYSTDAFTPYGYAWNLGVPIINRDSKKGIPGLYSSNDFVANGVGLILIDESLKLYQSKLTNNLSKYYFENNTWRVVDSKGNTFYYGTNINSKLSDPSNVGKTYSWSLNKQIDNRGNEIIYNYFKDNNQVYLDNITYAGTLYKVQFNYIDKARSLTSYRTQFEVKTSKLLSEVVLYTDNIETKRYTLTYDNKDTVFSHLTGFAETSGSGMKSKYDFSYGAGKDMHLLQQINDNKGLQVNFEYKPSVFYKDSEGINLNPNLPFNQKTLHKISYLDSVTGIQNTESYEYAGGAFYFDAQDLYGREYAGFNKVTKTDSEGVKEIFYFHQGENSIDHPELGEFEDHISKKGKIYRTELFDPTGGLLKSEITKWTTQFEGNMRWKVLKERETKNLISGNNRISSSIEYDYDIHGNTLQATEYGEVTVLNDAGDFNDIKSDKRFTKFSYSKNDTKNLYGFINSQELYDNDNILLSRKKFLYDNLSTGNVDFGAVTSLKTYENESNFSEQKTVYNEKGLAIKTINPMGGETNYVYDTYGIYLLSVTNALGFTESYEYDYKSGKPIKHTSVNGLKTLSSYDNFGRLLSESITLDSTYKIKEITYDNVSIPNNIKQSIYFDTSGNNKQEVYTYINGFGNEVETKKSYKNTYSTSKVEYDKRGNKVFISYPVFETSSEFTPLNKEVELGDSYLYDAQNRLLKISNKSGDISYIYNNLDFLITNQAGITTQYMYDIFGNLIQVIEPGNFITKYSYSPLGQLTQVNDAEGNLRNIFYDLAGKRTQIEDLHNPSDSDFGSRKYEYNLNGNIVKYTTLSDDNIIYTYDDLDRLYSESVGSSITQYNYDSGSYGKGLLSSYTKGDYTENYEYDLRGNLVSESKKFGTDEYTFNYDYNLIGQKIQDIYPDGKITIYNYENGIASGVNYDGTDLAQSLEYNPALKITDLTYGNNALTKNIYDYEYGYRLSKKGLLFGSEQYGLTDYSFDSLGNIVSLNESGNIPDFQKTVTYNYDDLNRLLEAKYTDSEKYDYTYNSIGNILSNSMLGDYSYNDNGKNNPHSVTAITPPLSLEEEGVIARQYQYDNNGNIISESQGGVTLKSYNYNSKDELVSFSDTTGNTVNYQYDNSGIRVEKKSAEKLSRYLGKNYEIEVNNSGTGTTTSISKYIFLGSKKLATVEGGTLIYHHEDHLGGGNIDLDASGNLLQVVDYLPFGSIRTRKNYGSYENKYLFGGKEQDTESDLQYFEARYYDNEIGRFESIDRVFWEIGITKRGKKILLIPQNLNSYSYVSNNPIRYIDPTGEIYETPWDIGNVIYDGGRIVKNSVEGGVGLGVMVYGYFTGQEHYIEAGQKGVIQNQAEMNEAIVDIGADLIATAAPGVPAGGTKVLRAGDNLWDKSKTYRNLQGTDFFKGNKELIKTKIRNQGQSVFKDGKSGNYYSLDNLHKNHIEVFNKKGQHLGSADPSNGKIIDGTKKDYKINIK